MDFLDKEIIVKLCVSINIAVFIFQILILSLPERPVCCALLMWGYFVAEKFILQKVGAPSDFMYWYNYLFLVPPIIVPILAWSRSFLRFKKALISFVFWIWPAPPNAIQRSNQFQPVQQPLHVPVPPQVRPFRKRGPKIKREKLQQITRTIRNRFFHGTSLQVAMDILKNNRVRLGIQDSFWVADLFSYAQNHSKGRGYGKIGIVEFRLTNGYQLNSKGGNRYAATIPRADHNKFYQFKSLTPIAVWGVNGNLIAKRG